MNSDDQNFLNFGHSNDAESVIDVDEYPDPGDFGYQVCS